VTAAVRALDVSALSAPVSAAERDATRARIRGDVRYAEWASRSQTSTIVVCAVFATVLGGFLAAMLVAWIGGGTRIPGPPAALVTLLVALGFVVALFVGSLVALARAVRSSHSLDALVRVERFAAANGLRFSPRDRNTAYPGQRLTPGVSYLLDRVRPLDAGQPDYGTIGAPGRHGRVDSTGIGYLALRLDRNLPHMVLHRRGRGFAGLDGFGIVGDGRALELEGDFGAHFSLHVPPGYERDALYVFTPDVMAALIDEASGFAVEIVDGWLLLYTRALDVTKPHTHERMRRLADILGSQLRDQSDAYRDDRIPRRALDPLSPNRVAARGRRLPRFVWIPGAVLAVAVATSPFWGVIVGWFAD